jgi:hypothetical protein
MGYKINYQNIPVLAIGFSRSDGLIAKGIQLFRGLLFKKEAPNHAFFVTEDHGQLFATEETLGGLKENSLEQYANPHNKIVALYTWKGFDNDSTRDMVQRYLAEIRRRAKENSKYDVIGLLSFVPGLKLFCKPDPEMQWCSENVASVLKIHGCTEITKTTLSPDQLIAVMQKHVEEFTNIAGYYI